MNIDVDFKINYNEIDVDQVPDKILKHFSLREWVENRIAYWERDSSADRAPKKETALKELYAVRRIIDMQFLPTSFSFRGEFEGRQE